MSYLYVAYDRVPRIMYQMIIVSKAAFNKLGNFLLFLAAAFKLMTIPFPSKENMAMPI